MATWVFVALYLTVGVLAGRRAAGAETKPEQAAFTGVAVMLMWPVFYALILLVVFAQAVFPAKASR